MKKTAKVILRAFFAIALIASVGFLSGRAVAASNPLTVTDASVTTKSDGVTAEISKVENNEITNSVTFNKVNDSVTFKLSIKNTGDKKLTIKSVVDDNSNEFIGYSYEDYAGTELDAGASFNFILKAAYKKAVADISARNQSFNVSFSFAYETETGETGEQAVVVTPETPKTAETSNTPNTLDNILHYLGIFALAAAGLVLSIFLIKSANKKIKTAGLAIALVMTAALAMPIIANANDDLAPIKFVNEYALMDRIVVTYNDGSADHTVEINNGDTIDLDDPEVPGYIFGGWEDEDGNEFDPTQPITGDITIHPVLDPIHYTIAIDTDGDGDVDLTISATYGESVELPNNEANKPGHTPNGWTDGTHHFDNNTRVNKLTSVNHATVRISPDWIQDQYTVALDPGNGTLSAGPIEGVYGDEVNLPTPTAQTGEKFTGWYTDATEGEKVSSPYTLIGTTTLYAHYRELATEATFGSGSFVNQIMKNINPNVVTFRKYPTDPQPDDDYAGYSEVSDENSPAKIYLWQDPNDGDTINWWTEAPVAYVNTNYGNNMFYTLGKLKNIDLTDIDVSRAKSLARFFSSTAITEIDLSGWNTQNVTSMASMFGDCSALKSVTFGQNFNTSKVTNMSLMFDSDSSLQSLDLSMFNAEKVINMMAMFRSVKMTELDLSSFSTPALTNIKLMFVGADQLQTIYVGEGWNTDHITQSNGTDANANDYSVFGNNFNLVGGAGAIYSASNPKHKPYARVDNPDNNEPGYFTLKNKRYVRFDANGGEGAMNSRYMASGDTLPGNDFARENHTFTGWNTQADGGGTSYSDRAALNMTISKTPLTLYAQWEEIRGVLYHANGQGVEGSMSIQDASAGDSVELKSTNFSRAGYGFAGWNTEADGTGVVYGPNQTIVMPEGAVFDLYAMWIAPEQDVTMQTFDASAEPYASAAIGTVKALRDIRDDNVYTVAKLADGKWWMTESLRLDLSTHGDKINSSNTHNPLDSFITEASVKPESAPFGSTACSPQPECIDTIRFVNKHITRADNSMVYGNGVFYNWHVATAGHGANMTIEGTSTEGDICSKGWHLPTGKNTTTGEYYALARAIYNSNTPPTDDDSKFTEAPNNFLHSGWGSDASNLQYGYYWTSTFRRLTSTIKNAYNFTLAKGYASYTSAPARTALLSVRCVAD